MSTNQTTTTTTDIRKTTEWKTLFSELQRLQDSVHHDHHDIITITGFFGTLAELEAHVRANR